jgi:nicotinamidase-related amidase
MVEKIELDTKSAALLVMDFQKAIVDMVQDGKEALLDRTAGLITVARNAGVPVIHVVVGFRPGYPEVNGRNKSFGAIRQAGRIAAGDPSVEIHPAVAPTQGEVVVTKHRVSGFFGTDLDMVLRANGIETLVLTGIATSGVVLSTLRHGADADYAIFVVEDCCADADAEVHRVLTEKVFPRQAAVVDCASVITVLDGCAS